MAIKDMNDLIQNESVKEFVKKADMKKTKTTNKKNVGRPTKKDSEKATEQVLAKVTPGDKKKIEKRAKELGFNSVSSFIIFSLAQQGAFNP